MIAIGRTGFSRNPPAHAKCPSASAGPAADDVAQPRRLAAELAALDADPALVLVGCWCETIDDDGASIGALHYPAAPARVRREALRANPVVLPSMMFRREAYDAVGGFRLDFGYAFDYDLVREVYPRLKELR